ncbi:hypothetical protein PROFUN_14435 [Planoprotostelium fungivorum]|uniref:F-box domain-containing protein n=1 Tax=Planoprotostelium fungivorum TaxID=1890364 RepID=A0A2P6N089_9EUKA|nr:hypothetical protein PROFUN_14435 [Planoprotostelium fungivorum]
MVIIFLSLLGGSPNVVRSSDLPFETRPRNEEFDVELDPILEEIRIFFLEDDKDRREPYDPDENTLQPAEINFNALYSGVTIAKDRNILMFKYTSIREAIGRRSIPILNYLLYEITNSRLEVKQIVRWCIEIGNIELLIAALDFLVEGDYDPIECIRLAIEHAREDMINLVTSQWVPVDVVSNWILVGDILYLSMILSRDDVVFDSDAISSVLIEVYKEGRVDVVEMIFQEHRYDILQAQHLFQWAVTSECVEMMLLLLHHPNMIAKNFAHSLKDLTFYITPEMVDVLCQNEGFRCILCGLPFLTLLVLQYGRMNHRLDSVKKIVANMDTPIPLSLTQKTTRSITEIILESPLSRSRESEEWAVQNGFLTLSQTLHLQRPEGESFRFFFDLPIELQRVIMDLIVGQSSWGCEFSTVSLPFFKLLESDILWEKKTRERFVNFDTLNLATCSAWDVHAMRWSQRSQIGFEGVRRPCFWRILYYTFCHLSCEHSNLDSDNPVAGSFFLEPEISLRGEDYDKARRFVAKLHERVLCYFPWLSCLRAYTNQIGGHLDRGEECEESSDSVVIEMFVGEWGKMNLMVEGRETVFHVDMTEEMTKEWETKFMEKLESEFHQTTTLLNMNTFRRYPTEWTGLWQEMKQQVDHTSHLIYEKIQKLSDRLETLTHEKDNFRVNVRLNAYLDTLFGGKRNNASSKKGAPAYQRCIRRALRQLLFEFHPAWLNYTEKLTLNVDENDPEERVHLYTSLWNGMTQEGYGLHLPVRGTESRLPIVSLAAMAVEDRGYLRKTRDIVKYDIKKVPVNQLPLALQKLAVEVSDDLARWLGMQVLMEKGRMTGIYPDGLNRVELAKKIALKEERECLWPWVKTCATNAGKSEPTEFIVYALFHSLISLQRRDDKTEAHLSAFGFYKNGQTEPRRLKLFTNLAGKRRKQAPKARLTNHFYRNRKQTGEYTGGLTACTTCKLINEFSPKATDTPEQ